MQKFTERREYQVIALGLVSKLERIVEKKGIAYSYLEVTCKDMRFYRFKFNPENSNESYDLQIKIHSLAFTEDIRRSFAFVNWAVDQQLEATHKGWQTFDMKREF